VHEWGKVRRSRRDYDKSVDGTKKGSEPEVTVEQTNLCVTSQERKHEWGEPLCIREIDKDGVAGQQLPQHAHVSLHRRKMQRPERCLQREGNGCRGVGCDAKDMGTFLVVLFCK
jgi:hypothetical protein